MKKHPWEKTTLIELNENWLTDFFLPPSEREKPGWFVDKPKTQPEPSAPPPPPEQPKEISQPGLMDNLKQTAIDTGHNISNFYNGLSTPEKGIFWGAPLALAGAAYYFNKRRQQNNANSAAGYNTQQQYF